MPRDSIEVSFKEMDRETDRILNRLSLKDARRIMQRALRAEGVKAVRVMKKWIPRRSGILAGKRKGSGIGLMTIPQREREDVAQIAIGYKGIARWYAHLVEVGTRHSAPVPIILRWIASKSRLQAFARAVIERIGREYATELKKGKIRR